MSDLPQNALSYTAVVTEFFLALKGSGLLVSPLDLVLVAEWEARGLPVPVVCRGLRRAAEAGLERRRNGAPPRSIRACRSAVEEEWRAYCEARVGDAPAPGLEAPAAQDRLAAARALLSERARAAPPHLREAYAAALAALPPAPSPALPRCAGEGEPLGSPPPAGSPSSLPAGSPSSLPGGSPSSSPAGSPSPPRGEGWGGAAMPSQPAPPTLAAIEPAIQRADAALQTTWLRSLSRAERAALGRRCALLAGSRPREVRPRAWRETLASHLSDQLRAAGLLPLRGSV